MSLKSYDELTPEQKFAYDMGFADATRNRVVGCYTCGKRYTEFPLDVVLPDEQWAEISPTGDGGGLLCAACIVERGAKRLEGISHAWLEFR